MPGFPAGEMAKDAALPAFGLPLLTIVRVLCGKRPGSFSDAMRFWDTNPRFFFAARLRFPLGDWMKRLASALVLLLASCAAVEKSNHGQCEEKASFARGAKDAELGAAFQPLCQGEAESAYREGFESHKKRRPASAARRIPIVPGWVCEVEASAKVFTGVGASAEEASRSAQATCSTHFQSSSCTQTECSRSL